MESLAKKVKGLNYKLNPKKLHLTCFKEFEYVSALESLSSLLLEQIPFGKIIIQHSEICSKTPKERQNENYYLVS